MAALKEQLRDDSIATEDLKWILARADSMLHFAEAKNGALVVISATWALWTLTAYIDSSEGPFRSLLTLATGGIGIVGAAISMWSFRPILKYQGDKISEIADSAKLNLVFFGDLKKFQVRQLISLVGAAPEGDSSRLRNDLAHQIVTVSEICDFKFKKFSLGLSFFFVSVGLGIITIVGEGLFYAYFS